MDTSLTKASRSVFEKIASMKQWQSEQHEILVKEQEHHREKLIEEQSQRLQSLNWEARGSSAAQNESITTLDDSSPEVYELENLEDVEVIELDNNSDLLERSFISNQNEPERVEEVQTKRIFPFLKRGQGLGRFRMSNNDLTDQKKRIVATISKKKSPSLQSSETKTEVAPRNEQSKPNAYPKAHPAKPAIAPVKPPVPKKVPIPRAPFPLKLKLTQPKKTARSEPNSKKVLPLKQKKPIENKNEMECRELPKSAWSSVLKTSCSEMNTSSPRRKVEQRELRIFERLEQLVDDSSFCSTSSVITRFMEGGYISSVQTTPQSSPSKRQIDLPLELEFPSSQPNATIENARALLKELAALKFGPPPQKDDSDYEERVRFLENNPDFDGNKLKLDLAVLKRGDSSSDEEELSKELELTEEELSKSSGSSDSESSSGASEVAPNTNVPSIAVHRRIQTVQYASSISSTEKDDSGDEELMLGSAMHARLEQLQREVMVVQEQQSRLNTQRSELAMEKEMLARAIQDAEAQKKRYAGSKLQLQRENQKIDELKQQFEEMQSNWKEKEARWASAQASQRAQQRQLALENKNLAHQIKELKVNQGKKVHFAANLVKPKEKPQVQKTSALKPAMAPISREEEYATECIAVKEPRITCATDLDDALRLYQSICCKDDSVDTSLVTPRSINKAYFDLFKSDDVPSPTKSIPRTSLTRKELSPPVAVPERSREVIVGSSRLSPEVSEVVRSVAPDRTTRPTIFSDDTSDIVKTQVLSDGTRQIWYAGGNTLKVSADGTNRRMVFCNGDLQESWSREGISRYFYAESRVWHETHREGAQIISYPDGQKEVLKTDGSKEVYFPDGSSMCIDANGKQMANLSDGSKLYLNLDGSSVLELPNGLREIRTKDSTTLQYPDGTLRVKFPSGVLETKYPNGRVRVKDANGKLIMDTHFPIEDV